MSYGMYKDVTSPILVCSLCEKDIGLDNEDNFQMYFSQDKVVCIDCVKKVMKFHKGMVVTGQLPDVHGHYRNFHKDAGVLKPKEIKALLDEDVVGQEKAKRALSIAAYNHYKRVNLPEEELEKSNLLLIGPTGSGKTFLIKKLAKILDVPLAIADATALTEAGYVGDDVESVLTRLLHEAGGDASKAEKGIVFIDEIDKLATSNSATRAEAGRKGVQQALLKLLEGTVCEVGLSEKTRNGINISNPTVRLKTDNILFICGGAFPEVEDIIKKRMSSAGSGIGFGASVGTVGEVKDVMLNVTAEDLRKFGMIPEFLGRLPVIVPLQDITIEMLRRILTEPRNSIVSQYKRLMDIDNMYLTFDNDALDKVAEMALESKTGARGLRAIMEDILEDVMFSMPSENNVSTINITRNYIEGTEELSFKRRDDLKISFR